MPKGVSKEVKATLADAYKKAFEDPEVMTAMKKLVGVGINYLTPQEADLHIQKNYKLFQDI